MSCDPSVDPLSATTTSPATPSSVNDRRALRTQVARVSDSFRQGRTTDSSTTAVGTPGSASGGAGFATPADAAAGFVALGDVMAGESFPCGQKRSIRAGDRVVPAETAVLDPRTPPHPLHA